MAVTATPKSRGRQTRVLSSSPPRQRRMRQSKAGGAPAPSAAARACGSSDTSSRSCSDARQAPDGWIWALQDPTV